MIAALLLLAANALVDVRPAVNWPDDWYPLGNGEVGCMVDGGVEKLSLKYSLGTSWTNSSGSLVVRMDSLRGRQLDSYRRTLDLANGCYHDRFVIGGVWYERDIFVAPKPEGIRIRIRSSRRVSPDWELLDAHGRLPRNAKVDVLNNGFFSETGYCIVLHFCDSATGEFQTTFTVWDPAFAAHRDIHSKLWERCVLDLPCNQKAATDFNYARYLMIASSRSGTSGLGVDCSEADVVNLPECFEAYAEKSPVTPKLAVLEYEHYLFNGVRPYLRDFAWPTMKLAEGRLDRGDDLSAELLKDIIRAQKALKNDAEASAMAEQLLKDLPQKKGVPFRHDTTSVGKVASRLLQSHERTKSGKVVLRLLPDLPVGWDFGKVTGLKARGDYTVDIEWCNRKVVTYRVGGGKPNGYVVMGLPNE